MPEEGNANNRERCRYETALRKKEYKRTKATGRKQLKEIFNDLNYVERKKESMIRRSIILLEYYLYYL